MASPFGFVARLAAFSTCIDYYIFPVFLFYRCTIHLYDKLRTRTTTAHSIDVYCAIAIHFIPSDASVILQSLEHLDIRR